MMLPNIRQLMLLVMCFFLQLHRQRLPVNVSKNRTNSEEFSLYCDNVKVMYGNPLTAKIILWAEQHQDLNCFTAMESCTKFLTSHIDREHKIGLLESIPEDFEINCATDEPERGLNKIFSKCTGWEGPFEVFKNDLYPQYRLKAYATLLTAFSNQKITTSNHKKIHVEIKTFYEEILKKQENILSEKIRQFKKSQHTSVSNKFYSTTKLHIYSIKLILKTLDDLDNVSFPEWQMIIKRKWRDQKKKIDASFNKDMVSRNRYLLSNIIKHSKKNKKTVAYAGACHLLPCEGLSTDAITELYEGLEKYADANSYAVLECPT